MSRTSVRCRPKPEFLDVRVLTALTVIVAFNFGHGPLAFAIASEMAAGRNRNKIMSCAIMSFFFTVWVIAFTSPYIYYDGGLGPMLGFVYAGTTIVTLVYVLFCVGETRGRSNLEIELFFQDKIPVRQWSSHVFPAEETEVREMSAVDEKVGARAEQISV